VADCVVSSVLQSGTDVYLKPLIDAYVAGIVTSNYAERIQILYYKLIKTPQNDHYLQYLRFFHGGSVAGPPGLGQENQPVPMLVPALVQAIARAAEGAPVEELLDLVSKLPVEVRDRFRAWILANWAQSSPRLLADEVTQAISSRSPTGDDV